MNDFYQIGGRSSGSLASRILGGLAVVMVIVLVGIGAVVLCIKKRRQSNDAAYLYSRERNLWENPTYSDSPARMKKEEIFHPEAVENDYVFTNAPSVKNH